jgi:hypothetical protein
MWCANCQTDVAGEVASDKQSLVCVACGLEVTSARAPSLHPKTREVRELLQRWSMEELLDPDHPVRLSVEHDTRSPSTEAAVAVSSIADGSSLAADEPSASVEPAPSRQAPLASRPKFRLDSQHAPVMGSAAPIPPPHLPQMREHPPHTRVDEPHAQAPAPHFDIASAFEGKKLPGHGESLWGQILAYGGVGLLTVGTVMVLSGYFGGLDSSYTPTGWLLTTAGQMLLFLGVVTLISGGMEQTTHEVSRHIQYLGEHIIRIERNTHEHTLRGPHFARDTSGARRPESTSVSPQRAEDS